MFLTFYDVASTLIRRCFDDMCQLVEFSLESIGRIMRKRGSEDIELFLMLNSTEHEIELLIKIKMLKNKFSEVVRIMLINVKMPTIVGILTFLSIINYMLSCIEHE